MLCSLYSIEQLAFVAPNGTTLPIAKVVTEFSANNSIPLVVCIEVHVEGIGCTVRLLIHNDCSGNRVSSLAAGIRPDAFEETGD